MNAICPDPRGPMVDRPDFIEGRLDALDEISGRFEEYFADHLGDPAFLAVRETLDAHDADNSPLQQYAADLDLGAILLETAIREAIQQARWKLGRNSRCGVNV